MEMHEQTFDHPEDIDFYGGPVKYYQPIEPFEVDGIVYDPTTYEGRGNIRRSMIDLIPC